MKPTTEQVRQLVREVVAGELPSRYGRTNYIAMTKNDLEKFAALAYAAGAAAMKERAAKVCEAESSDPAMPESYSNNHMGGWADGCDACAAAIRALGDDDE